MYCINCGKENDQESKFCDQCGEKLGSFAFETSLIPFIDHVEFLGYEINTPKKDGKVTTFFANHKNKSNLWCRFMPDLGISFITSFTVDSKKVHKNKSVTFEMLNNLNLRSIVTNFCMSDSLELIHCYCFHPITYEKQNFALFLEIYDRDIEEIFKEAAIKNIS